MRCFTKSVPRTIEYNNEYMSVYGVKYNKTVSTFGEYCEMMATDGSCGGQPELLVAREIFIGHALRLEHAGNLQSTLEQEKCREPRIIFWPGPKEAVGHFDILQRIASKNTQPHI